MFRRVAREFPDHPEAATAWNNAGAAAEKAGRPGEAVAAYRALAERYPKPAPRRPPRCSTPRASRRASPATPGRPPLYEQLARSYPQAPDAPAALRQAGLMRQTLGQQDRAAATYGEYERQYKGRPETRQVVFQKGLAQVERKDWKGAARRLRRLRPQLRARPHARSRRWCARRRRTCALGDDGAAREALARALAQHRSLRKPGETAEHAAQARYLQGELVFREYERVKIAGRPRQLRRALEEKAKLLEDARKVYLDVLSFRAPEWATARCCASARPTRGSPGPCARRRCRATWAPRRSAFTGRSWRGGDRHRGQGAGRLPTRLRQGAGDRGLQPAHPGPAPGAVRAGPGRVPQRRGGCGPALRPGELRVALEPIEDIRRD